MTKKEAELIVYSALISFVGGGFDSWSEKEQFLFHKTVGDLADKLSRRMVLRKRLSKFTRLCGKLKSCKDVVDFRYVSNLILTEVKEVNRR